ILKDLALARGREVLLHVNGLGGTPLMELYLLQHHARRHLTDEGLAVARTLVGNHTTSLEMAGAALTVTALDHEAQRLWDGPVPTRALRWYPLRPARFFDIQQQRKTACRLGVYSFSVHRLTVLKASNGVESIRFGGGHADETRLALRHSKETPGTSGQSHRATGRR